MERATLDRILQLANEATPIIQAPDFRTTGRFYVRNSEGRIDEEYAFRAPRSAELYSTHDLVAHLQADLTAYEGESAHGCVYYAPNVITAQLEAESAAWHHTLRLPLHPAFEALQALTSTRSFTQRELIRFLRATLNGHVDDAVVETFRSLKVATDGESNSVVAKGREAVDRRIQQQVTAAAGALIPEEIAVTVPVYDLDECRAAVYPITLLVEATTDDGSVVFEVTAVLNSLREAQRAALDELADSLHRALQKDDVPVYNGRA